MMSVLGLQDNLERLVLDGLHLVKLNVIALISQHISRLLILNRMISHSTPYRQQPWSWWHVQPSAVVDAPAPSPPHQSCWYHMSSSIMLLLAVHDHVLMLICRQRHRDTRHGVSGVVYPQHGPSDASGPFAYVLLLLLHSMWCMMTRRECTWDHWLAGIGSDPDWRTHNWISRHFRYVVRHDCMFRNILTETWQETTLAWMVHGCLLRSLPN